MMGGGWRNLDRILRGEATRPSMLSRGEIDVSVGSLTVVLVILAMAYGASMGFFALFRPDAPSVVQVLASTLKVPALFALTLVVTLPSLYVFNALVGSRLTVDVTLRLLVAALGIMLAVLASLGPIVAFFSLSTSSYAFMLLVNVAVFASSGTLGCLFLLQTLQRLGLPSDRKPLPKGEIDAEIATATPLPSPSELVISDEPNLGEPISDEPIPEPKELGALDPVEDQVLHGHVKTVFQIWVILFGVVGAQMGWVLRPFVGNPKVPFAWFRGRESNFFQAVYQAFASLFS